MAEKWQIFLRWDCSEIEFRNDYISVEREKMKNYAAKYSDDGILCEFGEFCNSWRKFTKVFLLKLVKFGEKSGFVKIVEKS